MKFSGVWRGCAIATLIAGFACGARAGVKRIEFSARGDVANGKAWGAAGVYEGMIGKAYFSVDPKNPHNGGIPNIEKAPRNAKGAVEFSADIVILTPKDPGKGNGVALFEVPNRGAQTLFEFFDNLGVPGAGSGGPEQAEFGDGLLLKQGYTLVWVGWQFSIPRDGDGIGIDLPIAMENGKPMTGRVNAPFTPNGVSTTIDLDPDSALYPPVDINSPDATLTVTQNVYDTPRTIPREQWQFARAANGQVVPDAQSLYLRSGFQAGQTYLLSYTAKNTPVGGLGLAALRDVAAAFRKPGAPVLAKYEYAFGMSQTGRYLREFLYEGFNADEQGQKVFDAVWSHIAGAVHADFSQPFSLPNGLSIYTGARYPFSDAAQSDPATGKTDGLLAHMSREVMPKIVYTNGDCEYWGLGRAAGLLAASLDGKKDEPVPDNVRIYQMAGAQHIPARFPPSANGTQQRANPNDYMWAMRAILAGLDGWVRKGVAPPASRYARLEDHTLVAEQELKFPAIPGVRSPLAVSGAYRVDLGSAETAPKLPFLVPNVDGDGNDTGGIRLPDVAVPLATYTGWNFRSPAIGAPGELLPLTGSFLPFPATRADREQAHDPRPSIAERYASREAYLRQVRDAAQKLVTERYLLAGDAGFIEQHAGQVWDALTTRKN